MQTSEHINELAAALAKAQGSIQSAEKSGSNKHLGSRYATLTSMWAACREHLSANGIAVVQAPSSGDDGSVCVTTRIVHSSGQWMESVMCCRPAKFDAQSMGSVTTYLKKYMLAAMVGVAPDDDDDGEAAMGRGSSAGEEMPPAHRQSPPQPRQPPKPPPKAPTPAANGTPPGGSEAPSRPPVDWEQGDPMPIPDAEGNVEVIYTDSRGGEHRMPSAKALAKIEAAHKSNISDAALDDLIRVNRAWLAPHYATALKTFEKAPRPWVKE